MRTVEPAHWYKGIRLIACVDVCKTAAVWDGELPSRSLLSSPSLQTPVEVLRGAKTRPLHVIIDLGRENRACARWLRQQHVSQAWLKSPFFSSSFRFPGTYLVGVFFFLSTHVRSLFPAGELAGLGPGKNEKKAPVLSSTLLLTEPVGLAWTWIFDVVVWQRSTPTVRDGAVPESATLCAASTVTFFAWPACSLVWSRRWMFQGRHLQQKDATGKRNPVRVPGLADSEQACAF